MVFPLMMQKGKIQRTQNAPNEPCIFLSRERTKNAKKKYALIFLQENVKLVNTGCCHYTEQRGRNTDLILPDGVSGRKAHLDSVLSGANNENRLNKMVIQGLKYRERECTAILIGSQCNDIRSSLLLEQAKFLFHFSGRRK